MLNFEDYLSDVLVGLHVLVGNLDLFQCEDAVNDRTKFARREEWHAPLRKLPQMQTEHSTKFYFAQGNRDGRC